MRQERQTVSRVQDVSGLTPAPFQSQTESIYVDSSGIVVRVHTTLGMVRMSDGGGATCPAYLPWVRIKIVEFHAIDGICYTSTLCEKEIRVVFNRKPYSSEKPNVASQS